jgi:cyclophilin family peptidyl-prolyl cis-trans isomerase
MKKGLVILFISLMSSMFVSAQKKDHVLTLETDKGKLHMILYDETPLHKANFKKLVKSKFYDGLLFHRVIENFMIQGGDPNSRNAEKGQSLGSGGGDLEKIPFEYNEKRYHKKGALAAARDGNPEKKSSATQFYIVQGKKFTDQELDGFEVKNNLKYSKEQREMYKTTGGTPHLDKNYTVFGEVIGSTQLVDDIAKMKTGPANRPEEDQKMKITLKKLRKKKITKLYGYTF